MSYIQSAQDKALNRLRDVLEQGIAAYNEVILSTDTPEYDRAKAIDSLRQFCEISWRVELQAADVELTRTLKEAELAFARTLKEAELAFARARAEAERHRAVFEQSKATAGPVRLAVSMAGEFAREFFKILRKR